VLKQTASQDYRDTQSLWRIESKEPGKGGMVTRKDRVRIRCLKNRLYLAVTQLPEPLTTNSEHDPKYIITLKPYDPDSKYDPDNTFDKETLF
jgi:hypothetical protein